jgi:hypothetical protein
MIDKLFANLKRFEIVEINCFYQHWLRKKANHNNMTQNTRQIQITIVLTLSSRQKKIRERH